ncbi:DUF4244 domain-containing protein [Streptomyces sp. NBC_01190]|uniref:DUF4244 domain-containing protein n=1 Tax=Streptomyces sp. NBC_01190 TaxID=2903767 RepID=UPI00386F5A96|nr:DUF4244 domain-containing protein [Streptomyces sp. NBC_01190]
MTKIANEIRTEETREAAQKDEASTGRVRRRVRRCRAAAAEAGMSTAEYAVGTIAACGFAAVLYKIVTSGAVRAALTGVIEKALHAPF